MSSAWRWTLPAALLLALPVASSAQRMGPARFGGSPGFRGARFHRGGFPGSSYPLGFFDYGDYLSRTGYDTPSQPQVIVLQSPQRAAAPEPPPPPSQPLMIELQGGRYVQISGDQRSPSQTVDAQPPATRLPLPITAATTPPTSVLIFRDGHRQQVSAYTIAGGTLYAGSDYSTTGSWNQQIDLTTLNLPETIAANNAAGHKFQVPSAPNEVVVGP